MSRNVKETHTYQSILKCFYPENTRKPSNLAAAKKFLPSAYAIGTAYFDNSFLLHILTGTHHFIRSVSLSLLCGFFNRHIVALFDASALKEAPILQLTVKW